MARSEAVTLTVQVPPDEGHCWGNWQWGGSVSLTQHTDPNHHNAAPPAREGRLWTTIVLVEAGLRNGAATSNHRQTLCKDAQPVGRCLFPDLDVLVNTLLSPKPLSLASSTAVPRPWWAYRGT